MSEVIKKYYILNSIVLIIFGISTKEPLVGDTLLLYLFFTLVQNFWGLLYVMISYSKISKIFHDKVLLAGRRRISSPSGISIIYRLVIQHFPILHKFSESVKMYYGKLRGRISSPLILQLLDMSLRFIIAAITKYLPMGFINSVFFLLPLFSHTHLLVVNSFLILNTIFYGCKKRAWCSIVDPTNDGVTYMGLVSLFLWSQFLTVILICLAFYIVGVSLTNYNKNNISMDDYTKLLLAECSFIIVCQSLIIYANSPLLNAQLKLCINPLF